MLTTLSILSLDQGKLSREPKDEETYFAQFQGSQKPEPQAVGDRPARGFAWPQWFTKKPT